MFWAERWKKYKNFYLKTFSFDGEIFIYLIKRVFVIRFSGMVKSPEENDRQMKRYEDNTEHWTGLSFQSSQSASEDKLNRWETISNFSVVLQRPIRLNFIILRATSAVDKLMKVFLFFFSIK